MNMYYRTHRDAKLDGLSSGLDVHQSGDTNAWYQAKFTLFLRRYRYYSTSLLIVLMLMVRCAVGTGQRGMAEILILAARFGF